MQKVCITTKVYVITVDDLYKGTKFYVRATQAGAENLFKKIVKEIYFFDQVVPSLVSLRLIPFSNKSQPSK